MGVHSQKRNSIRKGSEARGDRISSANIEAKGKGGARSQVRGECGVNDKGLVLLLGTKGCWLAPARGEEHWWVWNPLTQGGCLLEIQCLTAKGCLIWAARD